MNVSVREVADTLNLPPRVVEAIEANDFSNIQATFARGYIRVYAKLFELEADPLVIQYEELVGDTTLTVPIIENTNTHSPLPSLGADSRVTKPMVIGTVILLVVVIVVLAVVFWPTSDDKQTAGESVGQVVDTQVASVEKALEAQSHAAEEQQQIPETNLTARIVSEPVNQSPALFEAVEQQTEYTPPVAVVASLTQTQLSGQVGTRITSEGDNLLHFEFSEDCWVQVKTPGGKNLYSDLSRSGSSLDLLGNGPFRILLGYAPGVFLEYNRAEVALKPHTRNNVASFVIGQ
jgi:cytoskeleton protein RodZ